MIELLTRLLLGGEKRLFMAALLIYSLLLTLTQGSCPSDWPGNKDGSCYRLETTPATFAAARLQCQVLQGDLASPRYNSENDVVRDMGKQNDEINDWIGIRAVGSRWRLVDDVYNNETLPFTKWYSSDVIPDLTSALAIDDSGEWHIYDDSQLRPFICEALEEVLLTTTTTTTTTTTGTHHLWHNLGTVHN